MSALLAIAGAVRRLPGAPCGRGRGRVALAIMWRRTVLPAMRRRLRPLPSGAGLYPKGDATPHAGSGVLTPILNLAAASFRPEGGASRHQSAGRGFSKSGFALRRGEACAIAGLQIGDGGCSSTVPEGRGRPRKLSLLFVGIEALHVSEKWSGSGEGFAPGAAPHRRTGEVTKDELIGEVIDELLAISRGNPAAENSLWSMPPKL